MSPSHGYGIKTQFEASTGGAWPLNVGQVYTTLSRLENSGLVECTSEDDEAVKTWRITKAGQKSLTQWFQTPVDDGLPRDELTIKVLFAVVAHSVDVQSLLQNQRNAAMSRLQELTKRKRLHSANNSLANVLLLDSQVIKAEAEIKWLDLCETRLLQWQKTKNSKEQL